MKTPVVIYIENYAPDEQEFLTKLGLKTFRANISSKDFNDIGVQAVEALVRGPKLTPSVYGDLCRILTSFGLPSRTSPASFASLSSSDTYEASIQDHVPEMRTIGITSISLLDDLAALSEWGQVFIRSEIGSAAKFSGIESCLISHFNPDEIKNKVESLKLAHPKATQVVARRVVDVRKINGIAVEGRFVVLSGQVRYLDHFEPRDLVERSIFESRHFEYAALVAQKLRMAGICGDYFLDIAEKINGGWFVVEIKPLLNGTIRNINLLASSLLNEPSPILDN